MFWFCERYWVHRTWTVNDTGFTERVTKITTDKAESKHDVMTNYTEVWGINIMAEDIFKNQYISLCYLVRRLYKEVFTNKNKEDYCWGVCTVPVSNMNLCWLAINLCLCSLGSVQSEKKENDDSSQWRPDIVAICLVIFGCWPLGISIIGLNILHLILKITFSVFCIGWDIPPLCSLYLLFQTMTYDHWPES